MPTHKIGAVIVVVLYATLMLVKNATAEPKLQLSSNKLASQANEELRGALKNGEQFVKVHAAEALLGLGCTENIQDIFEEELRHFGHEPHYRVGIWRVLAQTAKGESSCDFYHTKIRATFLDLMGPDSVDAVETLAKLKYTVSQSDKPHFESLAETATGLAAPYRRWLIAVSGTGKDVRFLADLLDNREAETRAITAYALRHLSKTLPPDVLTKLAKVADAEPESEHRVYLASAAYVTACDPNQAVRFKRLLSMCCAAKSNKAAKYEAAVAFSLRGTHDDLPLLTKLLQDTDMDVRVSAANAILHINRREQFQKTMD